LFCPAESGSPFMGRFGERMFLALFIGSCLFLVTLSIAGLLFGFADKFLRIFSARPKDARTILTLIAALCRIFLVLTVSIWITESQCRSRRLPLHRLRQFQVTLSWPIIPASSCSRIWQWNMNGVSLLAGWSKWASISISPATSAVSFQPLFSGRGGAPFSLKTRKWMP
jgi:hypothetical protein